MCGLQFTIPHHAQIEKRPLCSACGNRMHLYKEEQSFLRFRCSKYPLCKTYAKVRRGGETPVTTPALPAMKRKKI